ncbi:MAG: FCSD flavin-binding domain-containing protein, partial [Pseudomonadota bacterium]
KPVGENANDGVSPVVCAPGQESEDGEGGAGFHQFEVAGHRSKTGEDEGLRKATYEESESWYTAISADMFS